MSLRKILITGGFGYVGGRIVTHLASKAHLSLTVASRRSSRPSWVPPSVNLTSLDFSNVAKAAEQLKGFDTVIHLAAMNEIECQKSPEQGLLINTLLSLKLLESSIKAGVRRILYFSTAHIYGAPLQGTITEHTLPRPVHPYALSHKHAEDYLLASHDRREIESVILRLSNGFGAPVTADVDRWTLLVNDLCQQVVKNQSIVLSSSGMQWRDFITLTDVCRATTHLLDIPRSSMGDAIFNVGGSMPWRVLKMAEKIADIARESFGMQVSIKRLKEPTPAEEADTGLHYSINKLQATGFDLRGSVDDEIRRTIELCLNQEERLPQKI